MFRLLRLFPLIGAMALVASCVQLRAESTSSLPLPENLFPELKGILEAAVKQSPRMIVRNAENAIAEQNRIVARSGQLPSASAFVNYYPWQRDDRADLPAPTNTRKFFYFVNVSQPIYHWGALESNTRIGELQKKITEGQTAEAYRLFVQEIRSMYLSVILRKMMLTRAQLNLGITQDQLSVAQGKLDKKVIAEGEMFAPRLNNDQAILAVDRATEDYENAKATLAKLTGTLPLADTNIPSEIPAISSSQEAFASYLASFNAQREPRSYYLDNLRNQIEVEKLNYKIADTRLLPKFNLVVGASQDEQSYTSNIAAKYKVQSTYAGVQLNWAIFDGFAARATKAASEQRRRQAEQNYEDAVRNLSDQARNSYKQLGFSARSMEINTRVLGSAEGVYHSKQDDLKRGLASDAEVNAARLAYVDAQLVALNSRFEYLMKSGDFLSTILEDPALANLSGAR